MRRTSFAVAFIAFSIAPPTAQAGNQDSEARRGLLDFITEAGSLDGRVGICDAAEADLIQACSTRIADSWSRITGLPPVRDPAFRQAVTATWSAAVVTAAAAQSRRNPSTCHAVLVESRGSGIWKICGRPPNPSPDFPPSPVPPNPVPARPAR